MVMITAVCIAPDANANSAMEPLYPNVGSQSTLTKHCDVMYIVAEDFNHVDLKPVLSKFHQHVVCHQRHQHIA